MDRCPDGWEVTTVEQVADINTGCRNAKDSKPNGRYKFFVRSPIVEHIDVADYDCEAVLTAGDGNAGKVFHYVNGKFSAHQRVYVMNNFRNISGRFFYYYFSHNFIHEVKRYTAKSTVDSVRRPMIANMLIPLPPLPEQQAIADTLTVFDTHITNLANLIAKKKAIRDGALEDLMSARTRLKGFSGRWEVKKLGEIAEILQGGTPSTSNRNYWGGDIIWVTPSEITKLKSMYISDSERKITHEGLKHSSATLVPAGTILFCSRATIGELAIASRELTTNQGFKNLICKENIYNVFLAYMLRTLKKRIISLANGTTFLEISKENLSDIEINLPPLPEQQAIADTLTAFDDEINALESERGKIIQIRDGAMNDLLTGKVRLLQNLSINSH